MSLLLQKQIRESKSAPFKCKKSKKKAEFEGPKVDRSAWANYPVVQRPMLAQ
jgi:hypothetical protein